MSTAIENAPVVAATTDEGNKPTTNQVSQKGTGVVSFEPTTIDGHVERHPITSTVSVIEYPGGYTTVSLGCIEVPAEAVRGLVRDLLAAQRFVNEVLTPVDYYPA
ncbi:hypothetical protein [Corynebacterium hadale]|uniref:hypothetical protein n=1 Tax=Corynebacterium hadale TaxID=2026255 RepID=UPI001054E1F8|nr:hypothetical protein [Corynebacterium hadale]